MQCNGEEKEGSRHGMTLRGSGRDASCVCVCFERVGQKFSKGGSVCVCVTMCVTVYFTLCVCVCVERESQPKIL